MIGRPLSQRGRDPAIYDLLGEMLQHASGRIQAATEEWIESGEDVRELVLAPKKKHATK